MAIPTIAPFLSSSSDPFVARWILDEDATHHVCNEPNMFDNDNKATIWVVFSSANKHNIKSTPRRLANVFYDPYSKVNIFALQAAQQVDSTFEVHWEDRGLYSHGVRVGLFSRRHRVFVEHGFSQRHSLVRSWLSGCCLPSLQEVYNVLL